MDAGRHVVVAGRSVARAAAVASKLGCDHVRIDLRDPQTWGSASAGEATILCCVDQTDDAFVRWALVNGRDYVDITVSDAFFRRVEGLGAAAEQGRATALLSVGLTPGLTNLMVKRLAAPLVVREEAVIELADQHVVRRTLGFDRARTLMTLESSAWTRGIALLAPALRRRWLLAGVRRLFPYLRFGRGAWTVAVEVRGIADGGPIRSLLATEGVSEANGTAAVAARVVELLEERRRPGVYHVEQLFELEEVLDGVDVDLR